MLSPFVGNGDFPQVRISWVERKTINEQINGPDQRISSHTLDINANI